MFLSRFFVVVVHRKWQPFANLGWQQHRSRCDPRKNEWGWNPGMKMNGFFSKFGDSPAFQGYMPPTLGGFNLCFFVSEKYIHQGEVHISPRVRDAEE